MVMIRLAKIAVSAALAVFALIVAYDNVFDYNSNYPFVRHVLSMDTIFPDSVLRSRAIDSETMWRAAYALILPPRLRPVFCSRWARLFCSADCGRVPKSSTARNSGRWPD